MPALRMPTIMSLEARGNPGLYRLLAWLSPSFPIGAFSYSHGLEAAAASRAVHDRASLEGWVAAIVAHGSGRIDADILRDAYRAAAAQDGTALAEVNQRGAAFRATAELALESAQQGDAFFSTCSAAWPEPLLDAGESRICPSPPLRGEREGPAPKAWEGEVGLRQRSGIPHLTPALSAPRGGEGVVTDGICHSAVFGAIAARAGITLEDALIGYLQAFAANLVSAGLRLGIIGQTDGQRILYALEPVVAAATAASMTRDAADFGGATFAADLASIAHETQYTRLFRS
jgi:urease accessory protein